MTGRASAGIAARARSMISGSPSYISAELQRQLGRVGVGRPLLNEVVPFRSADVLFHQRHDVPLLVIEVLLQR